MHSSQFPTPTDALHVLIEKKRHYPSVTCDVVAPTTEWIKALLKEAGISFNFSECEQHDHYGFSTFYLQRWTGNGYLTLQVKVTEIDGKPFVFAALHKMGDIGHSGFPFFQCVDEENGRDLLLNYIADFLLSTEQQQQGTS
jgi:hypothetical protein